MIGKKSIDEQTFCELREAIVDEILAEHFGYRWFKVSTEQVRALKTAYGCYDTLPPLPERWLIILQQLEQTRDSLRAENDYFAKR